MPRFHVVFLGAMISFVAPKLAVSACLTTLPSNPPFTPPDPHPVNLSGGFWYGTEALWTRLPISGDWTTKRQGQKLFLSSREYDWRTEPKPSIIVTAKRLDGVAPPMAIAGGTSAIMGDSAAMLIAVSFPAEGCWELTAYHGSHSLTFVVSVGP